MQSFSLLCDQHLQEESRSNTLWNLSPREIELFHRLVREK